MSQNDENQNKEINVDEPEVALVLRKVIQDRRLSKDLLGTQELNTICADLRKTILEGSPFEVWTCLSLAGRAASHSKSMAGVFTPIVDERIQAGLPIFETLQDSEDRWHLAKILQCNPSTEVVDIAFSQIARDDGMERSRRVWAEIGLAATDTREDYLRRINSNVDGLFGSRRDQSDSRVRRIKSIIASIIDKLIISDLPAGSGFSHQLRILFTGHISEKGPEDRLLREETAVELMESLIDVVRLSFDAACDPSSYFIAQDLRNWWRPASPTTAFEKKSRRLARHGAEALHVFARQGHKNNALRKSLISIGGTDLFDRVAREIVDRDSSLPEEISTWFCTGEESVGRQSSAAIEAMSGERLDIDISRLLIYVRSAEFDGNAIERTAEDVRDLMPSEGQSISSFSARAKQVHQVVQSLAKRLSINIFHEIGEVIQFDPAQHDATNEGPIGAMVSVTRPGTRKTFPNRSAIIILKPKVKHL